MAPKPIKTIQHDGEILENAIDLGYVGALLRIGASYRSHKLRIAVCNCFIS